MSALARSRAPLHATRRGGRGWAPGVAVGVALAAAVAGCAAGSPGSAPTTAPPGSAPSSAAATSATSTTSIPGETEGAQVFRTRCGACHGMAGEGSLGPPLVGIATHLSRADEIAVVQQGRGRMPAFRPALSDEEIAAVVEHTRTQLG